MSTRTKIIISVAIVAAAILAAGYFGQSYAVGTAIFSTDLNGRSFKTAVFYPKRSLLQPTNLPVILYSHGLFGCAFESQDIIDRLVQSGYVVVAPDHHDAMKLCYVSEAGKLINNIEYNHDFPFSVGVGAEATNTSTSATSSPALVNQRQTLEAKNLLPIKATVDSATTTAPLNKAVLDAVAPYRTEDDIAVTQRLHVLNLNGQSFPAQLLDETRLGLWGYSVGGSGIISMLQKTKDTTHPLAVALVEPVLDASYQSLYQSVIEHNTVVAVYAAVGPYQSYLSATLSPDGFSSLAAFHPIAHATHQLFADSLCSFYQSDAGCRNSATLIEPVAEQLVSFFDAKMKK